MIPLIVIGLAVVAPVLLALLFRVHASFVFMSICSGYFLQAALSDDVDLTLATLIQGSNSIVAARLILFWAPLVITVILLRKSRGKKALFQLPPLIFSGLLASVLALPLLPIALEQQIYALRFGANIKQAQDLVIAAAVISNLTLMWTLYRHKSHGRKHL